MTFPKASYVPPDRLEAFISGTALPHTDEGSVLFADISGFTAVTERLRQTLGVRRGAEDLAVYLNRVYDTLIAEVDRYGGSIIGFAGDAILCWFGGEASAEQAAACGFALLTVMHDVERITLAEGEPLLLGLKVAISTGRASRLVVGDPDVQLIDTLAGAVVARVAVGEALAERGEILADAATVSQLGKRGQVREWREREQERFAVLERLPTAQLPPIRSIDNLTPTAEALLSQLLPYFARDLLTGLDAFQIELRPVTALFLRFTGMDYDADPDAHGKLDRLIRLVQKIVTGYGGNLLQLTIGDKGSYLYAAFGAPSAHEDDPARALNAAIDLQQQTGQLGFVNPIQVGISRGIMRTGAYGGATRRTYGVLGDEVNLAARLMQRAESGTILISESMLGSRLNQFSLQALSPIQVKGKAQPILIFQVIGRRDHSFEERFYTTPLVGRADVLEQIETALQPIFDTHHTGILYVNGEAGMGKSRLVFEAQQRLQVQATVTWMIGQADQLNYTPLSAFTYFLRSYFGQRRERSSGDNQAAFDEAFDALLLMADETLHADLLRYRSFLGGIVGLSIPGSPYETADDKLRIDNSIAAIKAWARAESCRQPLCIQLEDVQWLDPSSARAVQQLTYNMEDVPLALVLTSRYNDDGTPYTISNTYSVPIHVFDLNRLSDENVQVVAGAVLNGRISERLACFVRERGEGNPFFTEQLALDLKERNVLIEAEGEWDLQADAAAEIPSNVNAILIARLDRLAARVKTVVQTASVLGREFEIIVLSRMLREVEMLAVQEAEREAIWIALDELRYLFRHVLLRDAAYQMQAQERLKTLHQLAAETIEAIYPDDETQYDALLQHWQNAQVADKILQYTVPVCERLIEITADYPRAKRLLEEALALNEASSRAVLRRLLGSAYQVQGEYESAALNYETCLADMDGDALQRIRALDGLSAVRMKQGNNAEARLLTERGLTLAEEHRDLEDTARLLMNLGNLAQRQGNNALAHTHFSESLRIARGLNLSTAVVGALNSLANVESVRSNHAMARAYITESLALATELGDRQRMASAYNNLGTASLQQGDYQTARPNYENALNIWREIGSRNGLGDVWSNLAILALRQGNLSEAQTYGEASLRERRAIGDRRGIANSLSIMAVIVYEQLDYAAAQQYFEEILAMQRAINERWGMATTLGNLSEIAAARGNLVEAQVYSAQALEINRELGQPLGIADTLIVQADLANELRDAQAARQLTEEALAIRRQINDQTGIPLALVALAELDIQSGAFQDAEHQLSEALVLLRELNHSRLPMALAELAFVKRQLGESRESVYPLLLEALTLVPTKNSRRMTLLTLISVAQVIFLDGEQYLWVGELIGLIQANDLPKSSKLTIDGLLQNLRPHVDAVLLDAALERGRSLELYAEIERLLAGLG